MLIDLLQNTISYLNKRYIFFALFAFKQLSTVFEEIKCAIYKN